MRTEHWRNDIDGGKLIYSGENTCLSDTLCTVNPPELERDLTKVSVIKFERLTTSVIAEPIFRLRFRQVWYAGVKLGLLH